MSVKLTNMYKKLLSTTGIEVNAKNQLVVGGKPLQVNNSKIVLPVRKYLDKPGKKIIFHPLNEDVTTDKSLTITLVERAASIYYNRLAARILMTMLDYTCDSKVSGTLTNKQQLLVSSLGVAYKTHRKVIERVLNAAAGKRTTGVINITVHSENNSKMARYHSPLLETLNNEDKEIYGIKLTKKQREMISEMIVGYMESESVETTTLLTSPAPTSKALFEICGYALNDANKFIDSGIPALKEFPHVKPFDFSIFDKRAEIFKIINSVPPISMSVGSTSRSKPASISANMKVKKVKKAKPVVVEDTSPPWDTEEQVVRTVTNVVKDPIISSTPTLESLYVKRDNSAPQPINNGGGILSNNNNNSGFGNEVWRQGYGGMIGGSPAGSGGSYLTTGNVGNNSVLGQNSGGGVFSNQNNYSPFVAPPAREPARGFNSVNPTNQDMLSKLLNR